VTRLAPDVALLIQARLAISLYGLGLKGLAVMNEFHKRLEYLQSIAKTPETVQELLFGYDDRTTAIMATGFIEDILALAIVHKYKRVPSSNESTDLFTGYGPLATLSARTTLASLLGIMGQDASHDLKIIRRIRNEFAHVIAPITFETKGIASQCQSLKLRTKLKPDFEKRAGTGPRGHFIRSAMRIFAQILMNVQVVIEEHRVLLSQSEAIRKRAKDEFSETQRLARERLKSSS
jgi:DNA-binding MltR family transcriptional regulator